MALRQEVNTPLILTIGAVSALVLLVVVFGLDAWFRYEQDREINAKWSQAHNQFLESVQSGQKARISSARLDPKTHTQSIPIEQAMRMIVQTGGKLPETRPATTQPTR